MIDENLRRNILVATRALGVGTDGHSTEAGVGVGRSWKVAEKHPGATSVEINLKATRRPQADVTDSTFRASRSIEQRSSQTVPTPVGPVPLYTES